MDRQLIERKKTYNPLFDVGLFWVPSQSQFVTWVIATQYEDSSIDFGCINGHYYLADEFDQAKADFDRRV